MQACYNIGMKRIIILFVGVISVFVLMTITYYYGYNEAMKDNPPQKTKFLAVDNGMTEDTLKALTQSWRIDNGYETYDTKNEFLCKVAEQRVKQLEEGFNHDGFRSGADLWYSISQAKGLGENLVTGFGTSRESFDAWLQSPTHLENLESKEFNTLCIKCMNDNCVQMFGSY